jgi:hypothetical protein
MNESAPGTLNPGPPIFVHGPNPPPAGLRAHEYEFVSRLAKSELLFKGSRVDAFPVIGKPFAHYRQPVPAGFYFDCI